MNELASSRRIAAGELARGVVVLPDSEQHAHPRPPQKPPAPVLASQDRDFLERAAQGSNAEVATGRLVDSRASRPDVIAFGRTIVADHLALNRSLAALAARYHAVLPASLGEHQASYDRVVDLRRDDFDREFLRVMIDDHHTAVELFREEASGGADPAIRAFASQTLPMLREHLRHAKALRPPEKVSAR